VYHYQMQDSESEGDDEPSASPFAPPAQPPPPGRFAVAATVAGICIWILSGFTIVCLAMAVCLGIFVEFIAYLDSMDTRAQRHDALRRWQAAHYCGAHQIVFLRDEPTPYRPEAFAQLMHPDTVPAATAPVSVEMRA
jgi:hypothetical protein